VSDFKEAVSRLGLDELVRYLFVGFVALGTFYVCDSVRTVEFTETVGGLGVPVAAYVFGVLFFYIYRSLIHTVCLYKWKDRLARKSGNLRIRLMREYPSLTRAQAELFWYSFRSRCSQDYKKRMRSEASGIHLLYMSSVLFFGGLVYSVVLTKCLGSQQLVLIIAAIVCGVAALVHDMQFEKLEEFELCSLGKPTRDSFAEDLGFIASSTQGQDSQPPES